MQLTKKDIQRVEKIYLAGFTDKVSSDSLRIYDGRDITPFAREFFSKAFLYIPQVYGIGLNIGVWELQTDIIAEKGIVVSKNINKLYEMLPKIWLEPEKAEGYLADIEKLQIEFGSALFNKDLLKLYDTAIKHLSFYADSFYPEDVLAKLIKRNDFAMLYTPDYSTYLTIHHGIMDLTEQAYYGERLTIDKFIEDVGYLSGDDIKRTEYETREGVSKKIETYKKSYSFKSILEEKENRYFERIVTKIRRDEYIKELPNDKTIHYLCWLAKEVATYNEINRKIVKKAFQQFRNAFENQGIDITKATYKDLEMVI